MITRTTPARLVALATAALITLPVLAHAAQVNISTMDNFFAPQSASINVGDTVVWRNNGSISHSVVADDGSFNSGTLQPAQTYAVTFHVPGTYKYSDPTSVNKMDGTITVTGSSAVTAQPTQTPTFIPVSSTNNSTSNSNAGLIAQLQAQIQQLLQQIQQIKASQGGGTTNTGSTGGTQGGGGTSGSGGVQTYSANCPQIGRTLQYGDSGSDVQRLQQFLALDSSIYPQAESSGYYGSLTQAAVERWQAKYNIVSSGSPATTGYGVVGPRTAAAIAIVCGGGTYNGITGYGSQAQQTPAVGGYIRVNPIQGTAPFKVTVTATVNTGGGCGGATYTLDFGDGTHQEQIPVPQGNCGQMQQTFQHVYGQAGTFHVTLSAGSHKTGATVTVNAPSNSGGGSGGSGSTSSTPTGSISSFTTAGTAPFKVTFYVSCVNADAFNVVFGDGQDLGGNNVGQTSCDGSLQAVTHTYTTAGSYTAQLVLFVKQSDGTIGTQNEGTVPITVSSQNDAATSTYAYSQPTLTADSANSLSFVLKFDLPMYCTGYDVDWGDGSAHVSQADGGQNCGGNAITKSISHTYAQPGSYTVTLKRGANLDRVDDLSITVTK